MALMNRELEFLKQIKQMQKISSFEQVNDYKEPN
jgi:hypothetical protein